MSGEKVLRPASCTWSLPKRPEPKPETAESLPHEWIAYYDSLSANESQVLYKHNSEFARKVDILLERRKQNGI
jgi:hypothetical protein